MASMFKQPISFWIYKIFSLELPYFDSMEDYIDFIYPEVRSVGGSIKNHELYEEKYWVEVVDEDDAHELILHIFKPVPQPADIITQKGAPYLYSIDGIVHEGTWQYLRDGSLIIDMPSFGTSRMYYPMFIHEDFFILKESGTAASRPKKYVMMVREERIARKFGWYDALGRKGTATVLDWREVMELMYNIRRYNMDFYVAVVVLVAIVLILIIFSI